MPCTGRTEYLLCVSSGIRQVYAGYRVVGWSHMRDLILLIHLLPPSVQGGSGGGGEYLAHAPAAATATAGGRRSLSNGLSADASCTAVAAAAAQQHKRRSFSQLAIGEAELRRQQQQQPPRQHRWSESPWCIKRPCATTQRVNSQGLGRGQRGEAAPGWHAPGTGTHTSAFHSVTASASTLPGAGGGGGASSSAPLLPSAGGQGGGRMLMHILAEAAAAAEEEDSKELEQEHQEQVKRGCGETVAGQQQGEGVQEGDGGAMELDCLAVVAQQVYEEEHGTGRDGLGAGRPAKVARSAAAAGGGGGRGKGRAGGGARRLH